MMAPIGKKGSLAYLYSENAKSFQNQRKLTLSPIICINYVALMFFVTSADLGKTNEQILLLMTRLNRQGVFLYSRSSLKFFWASTLYRKQNYLYREIIFWPRAIASRSTSLNGEQIDMGGYMGRWPCRQSSLFQLFPRNKSIFLHRASILLLR